MNNSGFRPYPGDEIVAKWEEVGGAWQHWRPKYLPEVMLRPWSISDEFQWRPVHPAHGWNHYPWMWQTLTGEDMTPKTTGPHWWRVKNLTPHLVNGLPGEWRIVWVRDPADMAQMAGGAGYCLADGEFGGPVVGMPGEVGR